MNCLRVVSLEPELEDGEVKFCPDCGMLLDPFMTYCPKCGILAHVRQTQAEAPRLMFGRYAVLLAGGFSFLSIFVNFLAAVGTPLGFSGNVVLIFLVVSLLSFVGTVYSFTAGQKRWNAKRLKLIVFSVAFLIFLGSLDLTLGFVFRGIVGSAASIFWAMGAFMILLSLPGLIITTCTRIA